MTKIRDSASTPRNLHIPETYRNALSCGLALVEDMLSDMSLAVNRTLSRRADDMADSRGTHLCGIQEGIESMRGDKKGATFPARSGMVWI